MSIITDVLPGSPGEMTKRLGVLSLVMGAAALVCGIVMLAWPGASLLAIAIIFGVQLLVAGIVRVIGGIAGDGTEGWERGLSIVMGVLVALAGILCLRSPALSLLWIVIFVAAGWLVDGVLQIAHGARRSGGQRVGMILSGALFVIGAVLMLIWPGIALATLVLLGGWLLIMLGVAAIVSGIIGLREVRKAEKA